MFSIGFVSFRVALLYHLENMALAANLVHRPMIYDVVTNSCPFIRFVIISVFVWFISFFLSQLFFILFQLFVFSFPGRFREVPLREDGALESPKHRYLSGFYFFPTFGWPIFPGGFGRFREVGK